MICCEYCGVEVRPSTPGVWREVTGWVEQRGGGGAHGVHAQLETGRYACPNCMALQRRGISPTQGAML